MIKILITTSSFGKAAPSTLRQLKEHGFEVILNPYGRKLTVDESLALMQGIDGMIAGTEKLDDKVLRSAKGLQYICRLGAGMDNVALNSAKALGICVENTPDAHVKAVAELTLAGMLSLARQVHRSDQQVREGVWHKHMGFLLYGKTVGLIGMGRVAKHLVKLLQPFSVKLLATDPYADEVFAKAHGIALMPQSELLAASDIVSLHVPYTDDNKHMIGEEAFKLMKPEVVLVNASRGGLIDEAALFTFLEKYPRAYAYLDTFANEPYTGPLCNIENILMTPHIGSYAHETRVEMETVAAECVINFFKNHG